MLLGNVCEQGTVPNCYAVHGWCTSFAAYLRRIGAGDVIIEKPNPVDRAPDDKYYAPILTTFRLPGVAYRNDGPRLTKKMVVDYIGERKALTRGYGGNRTIAMSSLTSTCVWLLWQSSADFRSALREMFRRRNSEIPADWNKTIEDMFSGGEKQDTAERRQGIRKENVGKAIVPFELYCSLGLSLIRADNLFAWLYMLVQWNTCCRSDSVRTICVQHLKVSGDAITIAFPQTKCDQEGSAIQISRSPALHMRKHKWSLTTSNMLKTLPSCDQPRHPPLKLWKQGDRIGGDLHRLGSPTRSTVTGKPCPTCAECPSPSAMS